MTMPFFNNKTIARQVNMAFLACSTVFAVCLAGGLCYFNHVTDSYSRAYEEDVFLLSKAGDMSIANLNEKNSMSKLLLACSYDPAANKEQEYSRVSSYAGTLADTIQDMRDTGLEPAAAGDVDQLETMRQDTQKLAVQLYARCRDNQLSEAKRLYETQYEPQHRVMEEHIYRMGRQASQAAEANLVMMRRLRYLTYGMMLCLAGAMAGCTYAVYRLFLRQLRQRLAALGRAVRRLGTGSLGCQSWECRQGEFRALTEALQELDQFLVLAVGDVKQFAGAIEEGRPGHTKEEAAYAGDFKAVPKAMDTISQALDKFMARLQEHQEAASTKMAELVEMGQSLQRSGTEQETLSADIAASLETMTAGRQELAGMSSQYGQVRQAVTACQDEVDRLSRDLRHMQAVTAELTVVSRRMQELALDMNMLLADAALETGRKTPAKQGLSQAAAKIRTLSAGATRISTSLQGLLKDMQPLSGSMQEGPAVCERFRTLAAEVQGLQDRFGQLAGAASDREDGLAAVQQQAGKLADTVLEAAAVAEENAAAGQNVSVQLARLQQIIQSMHWNKDVVDHGE
jgi:methyl-accepting chemotaxis protein